MPVDDNPDEPKSAGETGNSVIADEPDDHDSLLGELTKRISAGTSKEPKDEQTDTDTESVAEKVVAEPESVAVSPHLLRRKRRQRNLIIASVLTFVLVVVLLASSGVLQPKSDEAVLAIAPSVLLEGMCDTIAKDDLDKLHVNAFQVDDAMIAPVIHSHSIDSIETLIIDKGSLTDNSINAISALPNLRHLRLRLSPISDEGLKTLAQCETLWYINLPHARCTSEGVAALAQLPKLRQLRLGSAIVGNEVTNAIAKIETLRGIHLIGVAVTDEGLKTIAAMPNLESLYLDDSKVTEAGWEWLFKNYPQLHVHINQSHHDRDPKAHAHHD